MKPMTEEQKALYEIAIDPERTNDLLRGVAMTMHEYNTNRAKVVIAFIAGVLIGLLF